MALAAYGLQLQLRGVPRRVVSGLQLLSAGAFVAVTFVASSDPVPSALAGITAATGIAGADADGRLTPDEDERLELRHVPLDDAVAMVESGELCDAKTILGVLWLDRLRRTGAA